MKEKNAGLNKFAYYRDTIVGALCSRMEPTMRMIQNTEEAEKDQDSTGSSTEHPEVPTYRVYIMTLAVVAAYRGRGIGSELLRTVLDYCRCHQTKRLGILTQEGRSVVVSEIVLHVQSSNHDAIRFYTEKFDFERGAFMENYYRRIDPPHCYILYKTLQTDDDDDNNVPNCESSSDSDDADLHQQISGRTNASKQKQPH